MEPVLWLESHVGFSGIFRTMGVLESYCFCLRVIEQPPGGFLAWHPLLLVLPLARKHDSLDDSRNRVHSATALWL